MSIEKFAQIIKESDRIVFFGGAGTSTESGIRDYRSKDGLYNAVKDFGVSPEEILSIGFFESHPDVFYEFYRKYFMTDAEPNAAHKALADLEKAGKLSAVITQNIDGLHQKAGSKNVLELHGTSSRFYCHSCKKELELSDVTAQINSLTIPKCKFCEGIAKPRVVLYGEMLYDDVVKSAISHIEAADTLIVGGTSLAVYPAASFVGYFRGKHTVVINKTETGLDEKADLIFRDKIGEVFEKVMSRITL